MYNEDKGILGASIAVPLIFGLSLNQSIALFVAIGAFVIIILFYLIFRYRNMKKHNKIK